MFSRSGLFFLTVALAWSQTPAPATIEIRGIVLEEGTTVGIDGVQISLSSFSPQEVLAAEAVSSGTGAFRVTLPRDGSWTFGMKKDGYSIAGGDMNLQVKADAPPQNIRLLMRRTATIMGRVEDAETRAPLADVPLSIESTRRPIEGPAPGASPSPSNTRTDHEGKFSYSGNSGSYVARVVPSVWMGRVLYKFTEQDIETIDEDFEDSYWPGGFEFSSATPITVVSGASGDIGTIRLRKTNYYRLHIAFPAEGCESGAKYRAKITRQLNPLRVIAEVRELEYDAVCGQDVLIKGMRPGSYRAEILPVKVEPTKQLWSLHQFEVVAKNVSLTVSLRGGPDVGGRFVAAEGAGPLPKGLQAAITHRGWNSEAEMRRADADAEGRFTFPNIPLDLWYAGMLSRLPAGWVVSDVRFRGVSLPRNLGRTLSPFDWDGAGSVEIVVDNQPGSIRGTVMNDGKPASDAIVFLYPLPMPPNGYTLSPPGITASPRPDGSFSFENLPAGDYRIFGMRRTLRLPIAVEIGSFPAGSEKVTVTRGGSVSVDLKPLPETELR